VEAAAGGPFGGDSHGAGFEKLDEVVEDLVGDGFVVDAFGAEGLEVELVGFEFDAEFVGDVGELDGAEVRLAGDGADGGEFGGDVEDGVVARGLGVGEEDKEGGGVFGHGGRSFFAWTWEQLRGYCRRAGRTIMQGAERQGREGTLGGNSGKNNANCFQLDRLNWIVDMRGVGQGFSWPAKTAFDAACGAFFSDGI
jgi:hypothetical protein